MIFGAHQGSTCDRTPTNAEIIPPRAEQRRARYCIELARSVKSSEHHASRTGVAWADVGTGLGGA